MKEIFTYPLVSIIIPVFNRESFIGETLDSVKDQTYQNWECIIVDDGSIDSTINIIRRYSKEDSRFALLLRDRLPSNASVCRNIGLKFSKGSYIIFLDSDDLLLPHALQNRVEKLIKNSNYDFLIFTGLYYDGYNLHSDRILNRYPTSNTDDYLKMFLRYNLPWQTSCPIWSTSFIKAIGGFDERFSRFQDIELHTRAILKSTNNFLVLREPPDCLYRVSHISKNRYSSSEFLEAQIQPYILYIKMVCTYNNLGNSYKQNLRLGFNYLFRVFFLKISDKKSTYLIQLFNYAKSKRIISYFSYLLYFSYSQFKLEFLFNNNLIKKFVFKIFFPVKIS